MNKKLIIFCASVLLYSCTQVDDYMLGKDNTLEPTALKPIKTAVNVVEDWSISLGSSSKQTSNLKLKPEIKDSFLYTADAEGLIQAIDKVNGQVKWSKKLESGVASGPTVANKVIALGMSNSTILLLKQSDGSSLWQESVSSEVLSSPVIADNKVIVKTIDGNLYAFDLATGKKLWVSDHGAPNLILKASSAPVIKDNQLALVGYSDGKIDAIDLQSGRLVWQRGIAYANGASDVERLVDIDADPIIQGDVVYLASYQGYVGALSLTNGEFLWRRPASVYKNMSIDQNTLYMTDSNDVVWAINKLNGDVQWKQTALKAHGLTEPLILGNRLIIGDKTGLLHVLATQNGEMLSRLKLSGPVYNAPSVAGKNTIYVMTANGKLSRFSIG